MSMLYTLEEAFKELNESNLTEAKSTSTPKDMTIQEVYNCLIDKSELGSKEGLAQITKAFLPKDKNETAEDAFLRVINSNLKEYNIPNYSFSDICPDSIIKKFNRTLEKFGKPLLHRTDADENQKDKDKTDEYIEDKDKDVADEKENTKNYFGAKNYQELTDFIKDATTNVTLILSNKSKNNSAWIRSHLEKWSKNSREKYEPRVTDQWGASIKINLSKKAVEDLEKNNSALYDKLIHWQVKKINKTNGDSYYMGDAVTENSNGYSINAILTAIDFLDRGIIKLGKNN